MALQALRDHLFEQDGPADQAVAAIPDAGLNRQVQVPGLVDETGHFTGRRGDVQDERAPSARDIVVIGHGGLRSFVPLAPGAVTSRAGAAHVRRPRPLAGPGPCNPFCNRTGRYGGGQQPD